jgi:Phosphotransferase enzyme family
VEWFERELAAYRALARTQLGVVPRLLGRWQDPGIYPFPFAAVTRLRGEVPAEPGALIGQLGEVIACWHELAPVLVHGDIHQGQLLADGGRLTGILDWETARVDHPFWDLDLGQWGSGLWRRRDFSALWARGWRAYAQARGWTSAPARWRPPFASGTRWVFSPIPVIRLSPAPSTCTSRSYSSPLGCWCRVLAVGPLTGSPIGSLTCIRR